MPLPVSRRQGLLRAAGFGLGAGLGGPLIGWPVRPAVAAPPTDADRADWAAFRGRFLAAEGRVVDTGNAGVSHTEGQGWALLMAARADDRAGFDRVLGWTRRTLSRPRDALFIWRFQPQAANPLGDPNNATDGDLFIAWALFEAAARWGVAAHAELGQAIGRDILRLLVRRAGGVSVLLPGARGFERRDHVIVNPSYYAFPAIRVLAREVPDPAWLRLAADGLGLLRRAQFGRWGLPPDWLALARSDGRASLAPGYPPRFSFDAVRVPLYLAWAGLAAEPAVAAAARFWGDSAHAQLPAWTDLVNNAVSPYPASAGIAAIARLAMRGREMQGGAARPVAAGAEPGLAAGLAGWLRSGSGAFGGAAGTLEYYSAALLILARFAGNDAMQQPT